MNRIILVTVLLLSPVLLKSQVSDTIFIKMDNVSVHTVLTKPANVKKCPLAVIIGGSGPTDLNGNQPSLKNNSLKYLSDALVENKIATVRFDKRAIGKSKSAAIKESGLTIDIYADDVIAIINYYKQKGYSDIYIIGHSEGSLIGLIALQKENVKGFVSVAGAGSPAWEILEKQLKPKLPPELYSQVEIILDSLKNNHQVKIIPPVLNSLFRPSVQPYLISWFHYDPAYLVSKISCPVLIVQGNKDIQVDMDEANKLKVASKRGKLLIVNNMNHVLKTVTGDMKENISTYSNPDLPVNTDLINGISEFINMKSPVRK